MLSAFPLHPAPASESSTPNPTPYRILIDGEPDPLAFPASPQEGWAMTYVGRGNDYNLEEDGLGRTKIIRREGKIVAIPTPF